jgi:hypothetical protein
MALETAWAPCNPVIDVHPCRAAMHGHPAGIEGNARALIFERFKAAPIEKLLQAVSRLLSVFSDQAQSAAAFGFRNQPVKIGRFLGSEPDTDGVGREIGGQAHDRLQEGNSLRARPAGRASHFAQDSVCADDNRSRDGFALAASPPLHHQAWGILLVCESEEVPAQDQLGTRRLGALRQRPDESGTFDDQIRVAERDLGRAAVAPDLKPADLVHHRWLAQGSEHLAHPAGDDQGPRSRLQPFVLLVDRDPAAGLAQKPCGEETRRRAAYYGDRASRVKWARRALVLLWQRRGHGIGQSNVMRKW